MAASVLRIGRIEQVQMRALEVRGRQAVGDQDDLPVRRVLRGQELPGQLQAVLDVGEVRRNVVLADVLAAHVGPQPHHGVEDRHRLGHQRRRSRPGGTGLAKVYISMNCR